MDKINIGYNNYNCWDCFNFIFIWLIKNSKKDSENENDANEGVLNIEKEESSSIYTFLIYLIKMKFLMKKKKIKK